jgi:hypothetical protein
MAAKAVLVFSGRQTIQWEEVVGDCRSSVLLCFVSLVTIAYTPTAHPPLRLFFSSVPFPIHQTLQANIASLLHQHPRAVRHDCLDGRCFCTPQTSSQLSMGSHPRPICSGCERRERERRREEEDSDSEKFRRHTNIMYIV